jgi:hypothetical protein
MYFTIDIANEKKKKKKKSYRKDKIYINDKPIINFGEEKAELGTPLLESGPT